MPTPDRTSLAQFLTDLRRFVLDERDAQRRQIEGGWAKRLPERVAAGTALDGLRFLGLQPDGLLEFTCALNQSRFREGDTLCLNRGSPFFQPNANVTLEIDDETHLTFRLDDPQALDLQMLHAEPTGWVLDQSYLDLSHYVLDALDEVGDTAVGTQRILPLLMHLTRPQTNLARHEQAHALAAEIGLNADQSEAFAQALATDLAWLVQGPPGTGKTRVLAHLAAQLAREGERVFITAFTHRAINQALNTLARLAPGLPFAKIGEAHRADDLQGVPNYLDFNQSPLADLEHGYIVGATPFATRTRRLNGVTFDTVIFDEASQITLPLAIMGMLTAQRFIFFGDQRQLPPVLTRHYTGGALRESVFEVLAEQGFDTMLSETYRLNQVLVDWPSAAFYTGQLRPANESVAGRRLTLDGVPRFAEVLDPARPKVFVDLQHRTTTTRNRQEAQLVVDLLLALLEGGLPPTEVGVVVPYRAQGREIRTRLRAALPDAELRRHIVVDTVERMQGQEREVILVSLTTSNPAFAEQLADFFFQPERLNVAITRPRSKLILIGSRHVLRAQPVAPEHQATVALFRDLLNSCAYCALDYPHLM